MFRWARRQCPISVDPPWCPQFCHPRPEPGSALDDRDIPIGSFLRRAPATECLLTHERRRELSRDQPDPVGKIINGLGDMVALISQCADDLLGAAGRDVEVFAVGVRLELAAVFLPQFLI